MQYYHSAPAHDFATQVWTNNVWVAASTLIVGVLLGLPTIYALFLNMLNLGVDGGYMVAAGKTGLFFGLIAPHGILELTAVFVAAGTGLRLGWTVIDPGSATSCRCARHGGPGRGHDRAGLIFVLAVSGVIEAFVTPSGLPTWVRVGIGACGRGVLPQLCLDARPARRGCRRDRRSRASRRVATWRRWRARWPDRLTWVVFDLGETLIDETANWDRWAELSRRAAVHVPRGVRRDDRRWPAHTSSLLAYFRSGRRRRGCDRREGRQRPRVVDQRQLTCTTTRSRR